MCENPWEYKSSLIHFPACVPWHWTHRCSIADLFYLIILRHFTVWGHYTHLVELPAADLIDKESCFILAIAKGVMPRAQLPRLSDVNVSQIIRWLSSWAAIAPEENSSPMLGRINLGARNEASFHTEERDSFISGAGEASRFWDVEIAWSTIFAYLGLFWF